MSHDWTPNKQPEGAGLSCSFREALIIAYACMDGITLPEAKVEKAKNAIEYWLKGDIVK